MTTTPAPHQLAAPSPRPKTSLPVKAGVCLKHQHYDYILANKPAVGWFEIHAENYLGKGGRPLQALTELRANYALSVHGVGLSIGSAEGLDASHLKRVAALVERFEPQSFSEHLAWSTHSNQFYSDLLPVPYNREVEDVVCQHIDQIQNTLQRQMLLENPSNYLSLHSSTLSESELLNNIVKRTGCGLLLDVNNVFISATNIGYSATEYIASLPADSVGELHLAGHSLDDSDPTEQLLIDSHDRAVCDDVWALYRFTLAHIGATATLIEWDSNVPEWQTLLAEMQRAESLLDALAGDYTDTTAGHTGKPLNGSEHAFA